MSQDTHDEITELEYFIRLAIGESFTWALRAEDAPGSELLLMESKAIEKLETLSGLARDAEKVRTVLWNSINQMNELVTLMQEGEMTSEIPG